MRSKDTKKHEETEFLACHGHFLFGQHKPTSIFDGKYNISSRLRMKFLNSLFNIYRHVIGRNNVIGANRYYYLFF